MLESVTTAGIERSMPRAMSTSVSPMAAMPRKAASGMIARNVDGSRLRGTIIAETTTKPIIANQIAAKRIWMRQPRRMEADFGAGSAAGASTGLFMASWQRPLA